MGNCHHDEIGGDNMYKPFQSQGPQEELKLRFRSLDGFQPKYAILYKTQGVTKDNAVAVGIDALANVLGKELADKHVMLNGRREKTVGTFKEVTERFKARPGTYEGFELTLDAGTLYFAVSGRKAPDGTKDASVVTVALICDATDFKDYHTEIAAKLAAQGFQTETPKRRAT